MKLPPVLCLAFACFTGASHAGVVAGSYEMAAVRDASTIETRVIEDWHPRARFAPLRQTGPATFAGEATAPGRKRKAGWRSIHAKARSRVATPGRRWSRVIRRRAC